MLANPIIMIPLLTDDSILDIGKGNSHKNDRSTQLIREINTLAYLTSANTKHQRPFRLQRCLPILLNQVVKVVLGLCENFLSIVQTLPKIRIELLAFFNAVHYLV
jgi:hypothetical protein